jgi:hypothetical protein
MYEEKMAELNEEAIKIANGTHPELVTLMTEIEEKKHRRIRTAEAWRKYQHGNFQRQFEGAEYQANVQFIVSDRFIGKRYEILTCDFYICLVKKGRLAKRLVVNHKWKALAFRG